MKAAFCPTITSDKLDKLLDTEKDSIWFKDIGSACGMNDSHHRDKCGHCQQFYQLICQCLEFKKAFKAKLPKDYCKNCRKKIKGQDFKYCPECGRCLTYSDEGVVRESILKSGPWQDLSSFLQSSRGKCLGKQHEFIIYDEKDSYEEGVDESSHQDRGSTHVTSTVVCHCRICGFELFSDEDVNLSLCDSKGEICDTPEGLIKEFENNREKYEKAQKPFVGW